MSTTFISLDKFVSAPSQELFDIVANPQQHHRIDGSGTVKNRRAKGPNRLSLGSKFSVGMQLILPYRMPCTVIEFEANKRIAWKTAMGIVWRYIFTEVEDGTKVTEQWDSSGSPLRAVFTIAGFPRRNRRGIQDTLNNLSSSSVI